MPLNLKIDCGGSGGSGWSADAYYSGGSTYDYGVAADVSGLTTPPPGAQVETVRYSATSFSYIITGATAGANYKIRLWFTDTSAGSSRTFHIEIDSVRKISNYSIWTANGGVNNKATYLEYTVAATGTSIQIDFIAVTGNVLVSNIEIVDLTPDTTPPSDVVLGATTALSATSARFAFTPATDNVAVAGLNWEFDTVNTFNSSDLIQEFTASNTSPKDKTGLLAGRRWYARAKAKDTAATSNLSTNWSNIVYVDLAPIAGFSVSGLTGGNLKPTSTLGITNSAAGVGLSLSYAWKVNGTTVSETTSAPNLTKYIRNGSNVIRQTVTNTVGSNYVEVTVTAVSEQINVGNVTSRSITGLSSGLTLFGKVKAVDGAATPNESAFSTSDDGTTS